MTMILLANDKEKTIECASWEALATQFGMDAEAMPEDWDEEIRTCMSERFHAVRSFDEVDLLVEAGYIEY